MAKKPANQTTVGEVVLAGSTYRHDQAIAALGARILNAYAEEFRHLRDVSLAYLRRDSAKTDDRFAVDRSGGSFVRSDRERGISPDYEAGVWFRGNYWEGLDDRSREAWMFHQLSHLQPTPKGEALRRVGHDVEAFAREALVFGEWSEQLTLFSQNLDRHSGGPQVADEAVAAKVAKVDPPPEARPN